MLSVRSPAKLLNLWLAQMVALTLSASISWGSSWRSCDSIRIKSGAKHDRPTVLVQHAYERFSQESPEHQGKHLRTLDFSDGTTDTLSSEAGRLLVQFGQFGKVLEERHSILRTTPSEIIPNIDSTAGLYIANRWYRYSLGPHKSK